MVPESKPAAFAERHAPAFLFAIAIVAANVQLTHGYTPSFGAYYETVKLARTLAETGEFANPYTAGPTGPTAHVAPLLPLALAGLIRLLGFGPPLFATVAGVMVAVSGLSAMLMPPVSQLLLGSRTPGIWAGLLVAILPLCPIGSPGDGWFVGPLLLLFLLNSRNAIDRFGPHSGGALTGGMAAFLMLWTPSSLIVVAIWLARLPDAGRRRIVAVAAITAGLLCVPWTVRSYRVLGGFVFLRDNLGLELRLSNNDRAAPTLAGNLKNGLMAEWHPNFNPSEAERVRDLGELAYNRAALSAAREWAMHNREAFLRLTSLRLARFWFPQDNWPIWIVTLMSFAGLPVLARQNRKAAGTLGAILLLYPLLYYFVQADLRYRYPIVWASALLAGCALAWIQARIVRARAAR